MLQSITSVGILEHVDGVVLYHKKMGKSPVGRNGQAYGITLRPQALQVMQLIDYCTWTITSYGADVNDHQHFSLLIQDRLQREEDFSGKSSIQDLSSLVTVAQPRGFFLSMIRLLYVIKHCRRGILKKSMKCERLFR